MAFRQVLFSMMMILILIVAASGCGTIQIEVEKTPTPGQNITATMGALNQANQILATRVATLAATEQPVLTLQDSSEIIRQRLGESANFWRTVWMDVLINTYAPGSAGEDGKTVQHVQAWASQPDGRYRVIWGHEPGLVEGFAISDGADVRVMDARTGQVQNALPGQQPTPQPAGDLALLSTLAGSFPPAVVNMLQPDQLARRPGSFQPLAIVRLAGREALEVSWEVEGVAHPDRLWIDTRTGLILRWQSYSKSASDTLSLDAIVTAVTYDAPLPPSLFELQVSEMPNFAQDYTGAPVVRVESTPDPAALGSAAYAGELYFVIENTRLQSNELVQLPSGCLVQETPCPDLAAVRNYPLAATRADQIRWSPDGERALVLSGVAPARMVLYRPEDGSWQDLVEIPGLSEAAWSPDGRQIAYLASGEQGGVYLLTVASGVSANLTPDIYATTETTLSQLTWTSASRLLYAVSRADGLRVVSLDTITGKLDDLMQLPAKGVLPPLSAPDGRSWASTISQDNRIQLRIGPPGSEGKVVVSFQESAIWPLAWSPDGQMLAFSVYSSRNNVDTADLYVIQADGNGLQQIYRSGHIYAFAWAPDSQFLAVEADGEGGWHRIFLVPVSGGSARMIQAPGLRLDTSWVLPAWRN